MVIEAKKISSPTPIGNTVGSRSPYYRGTKPSVNDDGNNVNTDGRNDANNDESRSEEGNDRGDGDDLTGGIRPTPGGPTPPKPDQSSASPNHEDKDGVGKPSAADEKDAAARAAWEAYKASGVGNAESLNKEIFSRPASSAASSRGRKARYETVRSSNRGYNQSRRTNTNKFTR